ncbi:WG repeat-containing protein [Octadecabacter ascidiaceicola]|uniref:KWG Leptospira n=1 Tax=Octadecabacter ascidiaceicola TaxID=1655543 RepID=A0A238KAM0_9RHOB|nr:WG repeat-containing protein [Octadecabacter ascidiaceicola]SMX39567.1 hypothetical protein OCA8868_02019 [Octadecabacter ascidiaceicola]
MRSLSATLVAINVVCASQVLAQEEDWTIRCGGDFDLCGFYDRETGDQKVPRIYERIMPFSEGLSAVRFEGKFGFIDAQGEMVIEPQFDLAGRFRFGLAEVLVGEFVGIVNRAGEFMMEPAYARAVPIGPRAILVEAGSWSSSYYAGHERLDYDFIGMRRADGLWINFRYWSVVPGSRLRFKIFDPKGGELIWAGIQLRHASDIRYGLFSMQRGDWWTLPQYTRIGQLSEGLVVARTDDGNTHVLDEKGVLQFESAFSNVGVFENGFARVIVRSEDGNLQYGVLSATGDLVGGQLYDEVRIPSERNTWQILVEGKWFEVNADGSLTEALPLPERVRPQVIGREREELGPLDCNNGVTIFEGMDASGQSYGMMSADGTILIDPEYDALTCFRSGVAWAADFGDGAWCPVGPDGLQREIPACRTSHYPITWSHHGAEILDPDPFTSSVKWVRAYLAFECGGANEAPMFVGDGVQGHGIMPAVRCD